MSPTKKLLLALGALTLVLIVVAVIVAMTRDDGGIRVETEAVTARSITRTVSASGTISPKVDVAISPDVSGEIVFLDVEEGDPVRAGQLLARIRSDMLEAQQEQASAGVRTAQADLERSRADRAQAEQTLERRQALFERGLISRSELEAAESAFQTASAAERAAQSRVESAQASARQAVEQVSQTSIYSPIDGIVSQLNIEEGERVVGTAQMAGTEMMRIARLDQMEIVADVNENDVVHISNGDSVRVEVDAFPEVSLSGVVTQIANSARVEGQGTTQATTSFPVTVRITDPRTEPTLASAPPTEDNEDTRVNLRPGMSGTIDVFTRTVKNALAVPIQAVTVRDMNEIRREERRKARAHGDDVPENDLAAEQAGDEIPNEEDLKRVVFVVGESGEAEIRTVETGISDDTYTEIRSGLDGAETVITGPFSLLRSELEPGDKVQEDEREGSE